VLEVGGLLYQAPQGGKVVDHLFGLDVHPHWRSVDFLVLAGVAMVELRFRAQVISSSARESGGLDESGEWTEGEV
jgi:hypothetical protein